eukprot:scaffold117617_cov15-Prasinocladus_malaysianus.AAC.2
MSRISTQPLLSRHIGSDIYSTYYYSSATTNDNEDPKSFKDNQNDHRQDPPQDGNQVRVNCIEIR